ncbi:MAG: hypothetical protein EB015_04795 [Methylocystaceae bacterium]|nr:hypothetical protein [Methylocystaceae bacterium]
MKFNKKTGFFVRIFQILMKFPGGKAHNIILLSIHWFPRIKLLAKQLMQGVFSFRRSYPLDL